MDDPADLPERLVLYDGTCGFCHSGVRWLIARDRDGKLMFAPLQGETAAALRARGLSIPATIDTMVFIEKGTVSLRARAAARIARYLPWPWRALAVVGFVPWLPDLGYRLVARVRHGLGGRADLCTPPEPEAPARFLS